MRTFERKLIPLAVAAAFTAFGCSTGQSVSPTQTGTQAQQPGAQAGTTNRSVLEVPAAPEAPTMDQLAKNLPERISVADASRLLVNIPKDAVQNPGDNTYGVQAHRGGHWGGGRYGGYGYRGYGGYRGYYGGYGFYGYYPYSLGLYSSLLYYPYAGYYYPYSLYGGYYYPYSYLYNSAYYYPYLYGYRSLYYPYYYRAWL